MQLAATIRKYRKEQNLTQEQIANQLGVSAPAVNKWENGISCPDIELLAPLARLLKIDLDTLLSFREELSDNEIGHFLNQLTAEITEVAFEAGYKMAEQKIREFPNCHKLILWSAQILNSYLIMQNTAADEKYLNQVIAWLEKVAFCAEPELAKAAQNTLAQNLLQHKRYAEAQEILDKIPPVGFDKRTTQVQLLTAQEKYEAAFKIQDEMLYSQVNSLINTMLHTIAILCKQKQYEDAVFYADIIDQMAKIFQLGSYFGNSAYFSIYAEMKDKEKTIAYLEKMLSEFTSLRNCKESRLYAHKQFNENDGLEKMKEMFRKAMASDEAPAFIRDDPRYKKLCCAKISSE